MQLKFQKTRHALIYHYVKSTLETYTADIREEISGLPTQDGGGSIEITK